MSETQNIEYKLSWHDDYMKWVCGFANAQGGVIFIGKDDNGNVVGIDDYKKLMDDIQTKYAIPLEYWLKLIFTKK